MTPLIDGLVYYVVFVFAVTLHEAAHAWAALVGGDPTAYHGGQVSIDPIPHMKREPFGMVILPLLSVAVTGWPFGFASAPYDPRWADRYPRRAAWMALAGPGANLGLMILAALAIRLGMLGGWLAAPDRLGFAQITEATTGGAVGGLAMILSVVFSMNLVLLLLNLIPVPPLDGSAALPLVLPEKVVRPYQEFIRQPMLGWIGILVAWRLFDFVFQPAFLFAVRLLYPSLSYG